MSSSVQRSIVVEPMFFYSSKRRYPHNRGVCGGYIPIAITEEAFFNALARRCSPQTGSQKGACVQECALRSVAADWSFTSEAGKLPAGAAAAVVGSRLLVVARARQ